MNTSNLVDVLESLGAKETDNLFEVTHVIHLDVEDEIIDKCLFIYEGFEDVSCPLNLEQSQKKDVDVISVSSKYTSDSEPSKLNVFEVNFQWVYNSMNARRKLDENLFPIS